MDELREIMSLGYQVLICPAIEEGFYYVELNALYGYQTKYEKKNYKFKYIELGLKKILKELKED